MTTRTRLLSTLLVTFLLAVGRGNARAETADTPTQTYERAGGGGFALELSAGGLSGESIQGGILAGLSVRGFVFGLFLDAARFTTTSPVPPDMVDLKAQSSRLGIAARLPLWRSADGRVSLFAGGDLALSNRSVIAGDSSFVRSYQADGWTWSLGPGLRFWVTEHLAVAYLTRFRSTHLEGPAAALPDLGPATTDLELEVSGTVTQLEGVFQFLCVF